MALENGFLLKERYRILDILGQGGMGAVYRAMDENLEISVAIKENAFLSEDYARQFQREAKVLASLRHPNLPRVFDTFVIDQQAQYLVMDYIEGEDLKDWISQQEEISEIETLHIGIKICDALIYLHSRIPAITHRDIKPGNIKITPRGEVILVDFGLVKVMDGKDITTTAARAMTPGYSPPEQYGDSPTDHRSDIFSLGATLYTALAGYLPEDSLSRVTGKAQLTPLRSYNPHVTKKAADVIEKALELRFEDRWQTAAEFKQALKDAKEQIPSEQQVSSRIPSISSTESLDQNNQVNEKDTQSLIRKVISTFNHRRFDSIWLVYGVVAILLLALLGITLFWPEGLQSLIAGSFSGTPAITATQNSVWKTSTLVLNAEVENTPLATVVATQGTAGNISNFTPTPMGGGAGTLAFVSERTGIPQIWLVDLSNLRSFQLTDLSDGACQPDWSPDGGKIVFVSPCTGDRQKYPKASLYIINLESEEIQVLPPSLEGDFDPAWSPDGRWIAYTRLINERMQLFKIDVNSLITVQLSDGNYNDFDPDWSNDGTRLLFARERGYQQIWVMDAEGLNPIQFTFSGAINNTEPTWYPQKDLILFTQELGIGSPSRQVFGMRFGDIGKDEEYPLLTENYQNYIPLSDHVDVSPDGIWLAFDFWYFDVLSDIYIMTFPSANLQRITDHPQNDYDPVWRP